MLLTSTKLVFFDVGTQRIEGECSVIYACVKSGIK